MELYCERIGSKGPTLVLLHGMAGNSAVWRPLIDALRGRWPGNFLIPDLRGHGRSPHSSHYSFGQYAADVADLLDPGERVWSVAHSMGAVVALTLASGWYGISIGAVLGFGMKLDWTETETEKALSLATMPVRWFDTRHEAADRYLRLSGLAGLVTEDSVAVDAGLRCEDGRWRLAADARTFAAPKPAFEEIIRLSKARVILACGSNDQMVKVDALRRLDPHAIEIQGLGHNLHLEAPQALAQLIEQSILPLIES